MYTLYLISPSSSSTNYTSTLYILQLSLTPVTQPAILQSTDILIRTVQDVKSNAESKKIKKVIGKELKEADYFSVLLDWFISYLANLDRHQGGQ